MTYMIVIHFLWWKVVTKQLEPKDEKNQKIAAESCEGIEMKSESESFRLNFIGSHSEQVFYL